MHLGPCVHVYLRVYLGALLGALLSALVSGLYERGRALVSGIWHMACIRHMPLTLSYVMYQLQLYLTWHVLRRHGGDMRRGQEVTYPLKR